MLRSVYRKCMSYGRFFIPLNLLLLIIYSCEIIIPFVFSRFIDSVTQKYTSDLLYESILIIVFTTGILLVSSYFKDIFSTVTSARVCNNFLNEIDEKLERLPIRETLKYTPAYLNTRIFNDIITIVEFSINNLITAVIKLLSTIMLFVFIAFINIWMLGVVLLALSINTIAILVMNKLVYKKSYEYKELNNRYLAANNDRLSSIKETKMHAWYDLSGKEVNTSFKELLKVNISLGKVIAVLNNIGSFGKNFTLILTILIGGKLLINKDITIGQLILITSYTNMCLSNSDFFLKLGQSYQHSKVCYTRIEEFLKADEEKNGEIVLEHVTSINVRDLCFSYTEKAPLYTNLNLSFDKGKIYCLKGKNGDGKSTLLDILLGLNYDYDGHVFYNDVDILDLDMIIMRKHQVSVILQEPKVQRISVRENMIKGIGNHDVLEMATLCKHFNMEEIIKLKDSHLLSGGEKQKVSVIRGILKQSDVLVLDEPVSAMDTLGISILKNELQAIKENKIIIFISHNEELFDIVDEFIELSS